VGSFIKRSNGIYYGVFAYRGKRVWRSTHVTDLAEARRVFEIIAQEYRTWDRLTIGELHGEMLRLLAGKLAPSTLKLYSEAFTTFARVVGERPIRTVTPYHVELYMAKRLEEVSAAKVNIDYGCLKASFNRAVQYRMVGSNPFKPVKRLRIPDQPPSFLTRAEFDKLLSVIGDELFKSLVIVAVCTAMRLGELLNLRWQDIEFDRGLIHLENHEDFRTKTRRNRMIPLNHKARSALASLPRGPGNVFRNQSGIPLKPASVSRRFKRYARAARLPEHVHFHSLRHTGATWLIQSNVPLAYVKEILGHSDVTTTMIYAHTAMDHLRDSLYRLDSFMEN
jgi:integrase